MEQKPSYRFFIIKFSPAKKAGESNNYKFQYDVILSRKKGEPEVGESHILACPQEPGAVFHEILQGLKPFVLSLCELPPDKSEHVQVRSVSLNYAGENNTLGAVITAVMTYKKSNGVLVLNTPHKSEHFYNKEDTGDASQLLDDKCVKLLYDLFAESVKYIRGERFEIALPFGKKESKEEKEEEDDGQMELVEGKEKKKK